MHASEDPHEPNVSTSPSAFRDNKHISKLNKRFHADVTGNEAIPVWVKNNIEVCGIVVNTDEVVGLCVINNRNQSST